MAIFKEIKLTFFLVWVNFIACVGLVGAQTIAIKNPGFEEVDAQTNWAREWTTLQHAGEIAYRFRADDVKARSGKRSARIEQYAEQAFGLFKQRVDARPFVGKRVKLTANLRSQGVGKVGGGLYVRIDGVSDSILANDFDSGLTKGTHDWKPFQLVIEVPANSHWIEFGVMLQDFGVIWADDFTLAVTDEKVTLVVETPKPDAITFSSPPPDEKERRVRRVQQPK